MIDGAKGKPLIPRLDTQIQRTKWSAGRASHKGRCFGRGRGGVRLLSGAITMRLKEANGQPCNPGSQIHPYLVYPAPPFGHREDALRGAVGSSSKLDLWHKAESGVIPRRERRSSSGISRPHWETIGDPLGTRPEFPRTLRFEPLRKRSARLPGRGERWFRPGIQPTRSLRRMPRV